MNNDTRKSISTEISFHKNPNDFKFRRQNDRALTNINTGKEIYYFKNELLKDMKNLEKNLTDKFSNADFNIIENIKKLNRDINILDIKLKELSTKITQDNSIKEKVDNLEMVKSKLLDDILVNDMKVNTLDKEIRQSIIDMNELLKETVIYAGVIGPSCKFKTFHNYIDYTINELNILGTFKEKNMMDLSSFKKKIESNIQSFKLHVESLGRSSKQYTTDNINKINKTMHELFHQCDDKIELMKSNFDEKFKKVQNQVDDIESKFIKEMNDMKDRISVLEKDMNNQLKFYFNLKDEVNKLKENNNDDIKPTKKNSILKNSDISNIINNKNKINKRNSIIKNETMEEIKNNSVNPDENMYSNNNSFIYRNKNKSMNLHSEEDTKEIKSIKSKFNNMKKDDNDNDKLNKNLNINVDNSNTFNLNKYIQKGIKKRIEKEKNTIGKRNLLLSRSEQEDEKQKSFSPKRTSIKIKNTKQSFNSSSHSNQSSKSKNSKISLKTFENQKNFEAIKSMNKFNESENKKEKEKENPNINLKTPTTDKNIFNKNINMFKEQNKLWLNEKYKKNIKKQKSINDIKSLNIENDNNILNVLNERYNLSNQRTVKSSTKFKNIILTLEGTKKMVYETKDFHRGKNLYHIETLSEKNTKKSYLRERLESCRPFLIKKNYKKNINNYLFSGKEEPNDFMKYKNNKFLLLNKSSSSKIYLKNKHSADYDNKETNMNYNFSPSLNVTKYNPKPKKQMNKTSEEKSLQTEKNYTNLDNK